jgi:hypothetical protein
MGEKPVYINEGECQGQADLVKKLINSNRKHQTYPEGGKPSGSRQAGWAYHYGPLTVL